MVYWTFAVMISLLQPVGVKNYPTSVMVWRGLARVMVGQVNTFWVCVSSFYISFLQGKVHRFILKVVFWHYMAPCCSARTCTTVSRTQWSELLPEDRGLSQGWSWGVSSLCRTWLRGREVFYKFAWKVSGYSSQIARWDCMYFALFQGQFQPKMQVSWKLDLKGIYSLEPFYFIRKMYIDFKWDFDSFIWKKKQVIF